MNVSTQTQDLRNFVLFNLQCTLAVPVLVAILENDLDRLEAINKIIINMDDDAVEGALIELNQAMRDLGLRCSGAFGPEGGSDTMWFSFTPLPHGSVRRSRSGVNGTLHIHALNGAGELYVLSPAARRVMRAELCSEAAMLAPLGGGVQMVSGAKALAQVRAVLAAAISASAAVVH